MIVSRAPLRISFAGGGSDLRAFYQQEPGAVVSTAINKYIYSTVHPAFDQCIRASYAVTEIVDSPAELKHELIREALKLLDLSGGIEITSVSDVPSHGSGLGSSSAYTVGLLHALHAYLGQQVSAEQLASEACDIEIERCAKPIGKQDQYIAAYGGLQFIQFNPDESVHVHPIMCSAETKQRLQERLLMLYTGIARSANDVLTEQRANTQRDRNKRLMLSRMTRLAHDLRAALSTDDLDSFAEILHEGWMMKRELASSISNNQIDVWYARARRYGARGGKLLGAGGGGFLLLYAPVERHAEIIAALPELRPMPFQFEPHGSTIVYSDEKPMEGGDCDRNGV